MVNVITSLHEDPFHLCTILSEALSLQQEEIWLSVLSTFMTFSCSIIKINLIFLAIWVLPCNSILKWQGPIQGTINYYHVHSIFPSSSQLLPQTNRTPVLLHCLKPSYLSIEVLLSEYSFSKTLQIEICRQSKGYDKVKIFPIELTSKNVHLRSSIIFSLNTSVSRTQYILPKGVI